MFIDISKEVLLHLCREIVTATLGISLVEQVVVTGRFDTERSRQRGRSIFARPFEFERGLRGGSRECPFVMVQFSVPGRDMRWTSRSPLNSFSGWSFDLPSGPLNSKGTSAWIFRS
jgi:hypothetical protein